MENESAIVTPPPVSCLPEVLETVRFCALEAFHKLRWGGLEVGGVLFGRRRPDAIEILAARELACDHTFGPCFDLSDADHQRLSALLELPSKDRGLSGLVPVGLYRSFTRGLEKLTSDDLLLHHRHFSEDRQVMLALYPARNRPVRARFFLRGEDGAWTALDEFDLLPLPKSRAPLPAAEAPQAPAPEPSQDRVAETTAEPQIASSPPQPEPEPSRSPESDRVIRELFQPRFPAVEALAPGPRWSRPRLIWLALAWLVALGSLGYAFRDRWAPGAPEPLQIGLYDLDGQLTIGWQRSAGPLRDAESGLLEITDGERKFSMQLSRDLLQKGSAVFGRRGGDVSVRLVARFPGNRTAEGVARYVGQPVAQPVSEGSGSEAAQLQEQLEKLTKRNEELQRTNAELRKRLANGKR